ARLLLRFSGAGPLIAAALLVLIGMMRPRDAIVGFGLLWFWAAVPFIQFQLRHVFLLEYLVIGMLVWLTSLAARAAVSKHPPSAMMVWRSVALTAALCVTVPVAVSVARRLQKPRVLALLTAYEQAETEAVSFTTLPLDDGRVRLLMPVFEDASQGTG